MYWQKIQKARIHFNVLFFFFIAFFEYKEDGGRFPNPPSYNVATTLPSYDEAERCKAEAAVPLVTGRVSVCLLFSMESQRKADVSKE